MPPALGASRHAGTPLDAVAPGWPDNAGRPCCLPCSRCPGDAGTSLEWASRSERAGCREVAPRPAGAVGGPPGPFRVDRRIGPRGAALHAGRSPGEASPSATARRHLHRAAGVAPALSRGPLLPAGVSRRSRGARPRGPCPGDLGSAHAPAVAAGARSASRFGHRRHRGRRTSFGFAMARCARLGRPRASRGGGPLLGVATTTTGAAARGHVDRCLALPSREPRKRRLADRRAEVARPGVALAPRPRRTRGRRDSRSGSSQPRAAPRAGRVVLFER